MKLYQCVALRGAWHLTQRQVDPPKRTELWCWTSCCEAAEIKQGFEQRRPTCAECLRHVAVFEGSMQPVIIALALLPDEDRVSRRARLARRR